MMKHATAKKLVLLLFLICFIFFLSRVFSGRLILPQNFTIGFVTIRFYGLIMALAITCGFYVAKRQSNAYGINFNSAESLLFWLTIGGFLGARAYHVLSRLGYYLQNPIDVIKVWQGGLSIYGAVIGGFFALLIYKKLSTIYYPLPTILDWLTPSIITGQIIGRLGNFFNYELFGYPTIVPWKMFVPVEFRPELFVSNSFFHPLFLYEMLLNSIILVLLLKFKTKLPLGGLFIAYVFLYNIVRFFLEFLRIDSPQLLGFRQNVLVSGVLIILALLMLIKLKTPYGQTS